MPKWIVSDPTGSERLDSYLRRFKIVRDQDVSGVSGTGVVCVGVELPSGRCVIEWTVKFTSIAIYNDIGTLEAIHGHEGKTKVVWIDPPYEAPIQKKEEPTPGPGDVGYH